MYFSKTASYLHYITEGDLQVTKNMTMKKSIVQQVGEKFVRLYYARLNQAPESLHKLYGKNSSFVHGGADSEGRPLEAVYGQAEIHKRVMALNFKDCQTEIRRVDAHATLGDGVVVQAMGELSTNMQPMRNFVQTFVLAPEGTKKFYIHNDLFHYQDEVFEDTESEVKVEDVEEIVPTSTASSQPVVPEEEVAASPESEREVEKNDEVSVEKNDEVSVEKTDEVSVQKTDEVSVQKTDEVSVEKTDEVSVQKTDEVSVEKTDEASVQRDDEVSVQKTDEVSVQKTDEVSVEKTDGASAELKLEAETIEVSASSSGSSVPGSSVPILAVPVPPSSQPKSWVSVTAKHLPPTVPVPIFAQRPLRRKVQRPGQKGKQGEKEGSRVVQYPNDQQLFVGNLPQNVEKSELKEFFEKYGTVLEVNIIKGVKQPNFGFVVFDNCESVKNVLSNKQIMFRGDIRLHVGEKRTQSAQEGGVNGGGPRVVRYPDTQQVFVGNLPQDVEKSELKEFFEQYGTVLEVNIISGVQRPNFGFVVFKNSKSIKKVLSNKQIMFRGDIRLHVGEKRTQSAKEGGVNGGGPRVVRYPDTQQLFVGNLPQDVETSELKEFFEQYGTVLEVNIISGVQRPNFGFVVFKNSKSIKKVLSNKQIVFRGDIRLHVGEKRTQSAQEAGVNGGGPRVVRYPDTQQVFIGNIPHDVEKSELTEFFEQYGTVLELRIHSSEGKHPNFGFVVFDNTEPIKKILRNKRLKFRDGVWLNVGEKKTRPAQEGDKRDPKPHGGPDGLGGPRERGVGEGGPRGPPTRSGMKDPVLDPGKKPGQTRAATPSSK